jgi:hypothetical protein
MQTRTDLFFGREVQAFHERLTQLNDAVPPSAPAQHDATYRRLKEAMQDMVDACRRLETVIRHDASLLRDTQRRFQDATAQWFDRSWIGQRARSKPRGYPGDYLLLNTIYDEEPKSPGLGGYIDLYIMDLLLAHSVRARWQAMRSFLMEELSSRRQEVAILNVACGPCREYVAGLAGVASVPVRITCLDNDQEALDFVTANIADRLAGAAELRTQRYNALRMKSAEATIRNFGRSDIIYSIGLCDYISDDYMIAILEGWRESLNEGGVLLVAFKDTERYDETPYQWLLDWHFFQRTEEDCRNLFQQAGYNLEDLQMTRDATGVIMNFVSRARVASPHRIDGPHVGAASLSPSAREEISSPADRLSVETT